jgi:hypothetical protein
LRELGCRSRLAVGLPREHVAGSASRHCLDEVLLAVVYGQEKDRQVAGREISRTACRPVSFGMATSRIARLIDGFDGLLDRIHTVDSLGDELPVELLLTVDQLLDECGGVSRRTFFRWRELGHAPRCTKLFNGGLRVRRSDLLAWLRAPTESVA